ncbi:MAG TPA: hypothetical protein VF522_04840 [Ramlibacter sp.]|uniref:hypothetical protein n=1 Tax=Ramlibacter sp. TaxID=1917967 RepID=UPI002ED1FEDD
MDTTIGLGLVLLAIVLAGAWLLMRRRSSDRLEKHFGPEYHRTVDELGSRDKAEAELRAREKRVQKLKLVPLAPDVASRFAEDWRAVQARFVDNPKGVLMDADRLVTELMRLRGYPMADFVTRAGDISVDHPAVVHHYRAARDIALRDQQGEADTEALRQAVVHYRALFSELLEVGDPHHDEAPPARGGILHRRHETSQDKHHMESH